MTLTMRPVRVRIHVTEGQRAALNRISEGYSSDAVRVTGHTATFAMSDPVGWLEARMAEHPRGVFPRASLHAVLRKLSAAIQSQVEPDPPAVQVQPDREAPGGS